MTCSLHLLAVFFFCFLLLFAVFICLYVFLAMVNKDLDLEWYRKQSEKEKKRKYNNNQNAVGFRFPYSSTACESSHSSLKFPFPNYTMSIPTLLGFPRENGNPEFLFPIQISSQRVHGLLKVLQCSNFQVLKCTGTADNLIISDYR